ncbi:MAG TPA: Holliday junction branch migration protein RuvA [Steroidobacteraceae bacterium]|jgi:Holliday junction DNA helicase RuvA|nr:Holliday junction branch migration protein RuvA [Steroidobacteraceae bacterium]
MIGSLAGVLAHKAPPQLLLEVGGVGYELEAPMSTFYDLPGLGERVRLLTHLVVREDAQLLFGFATEAERRLFRSLLKIAGVGPRTALAILSGVSSAAFAQAVHEQDTASLMRIPGVGRKTAERLIVEMRDRLQEQGTALSLSTAAGAAAASQPSAHAEAYGALVALGYKPAEATRLMKNATDGAGGTSAGRGAGAGADSGVLSTEELIRRALQSAARPA